MSPRGRRVIHSGTFPGAEHARCALPEHAHINFFPDRPPKATRRQDADYRRAVDQALNVCGGCTVREACLAAALEVPSQDDHGVLGGMTAMHRNRLRKGHQ